MHDLVEHAAHAERGIELPCACELEEDRAEMDDDLTGSHDIIVRACTQASRPSRLASRTSYAQRRA